MITPKRSDFTMRPVTEGDIDLLLEWKNSDRIRTTMFEHNLVLREEHLRWFHSLKDNELQKCWIFEHQGRTIGRINIKNVNRADDVWIWGCHLGPLVDPALFCPRAGTIMGFCALEHFFEKLGVTKVIGEALAANKRSLEFNARIGFNTEKFFTKVTSRGEPIEAVLLTLTKTEWLQRKAEVEKTAFL